MLDHLAFIWSAWWDLHGDRPIHWGGAGDIPFTAIDRYAERYGIVDIDAFQRFSDLLGVMDQTYRDWTKKRTPPPKR